jgi:hypothetical protein
MRALLVLLLCGCGMASLTPDASVTVDSGTVSEDAGSPRDAGPFDAGAAEPTLSSSVLFRDDFERYADLQALRSSYPELSEVGGVIALERDGGQSLRLDYAAVSACTAADVHVGKIVAGNVPTVMVTWRERVPSSFRDCGDAGVEAFVLDRGLSRTSFVVREGKWVLHTAAQDFVQDQRLETHSPAVLPRDTWHRVTLLITRQSTASLSDGVVLVWVDGAVVIDAVGSVGTAPFTLATWPGALSVSGATSRWVDDLAISTP